jgi:hypothetical protein
VRRMKSGTNTPSPSWPQMHEINPWLFPSVMELAQDGGPIGEVLRGIPSELQRDANRCPDPWGDLCTNRFIPRGYHGLFRACASVLPAATRLARMVYSRGHLVEHDKQATTQVEREAVIRMLFPGMWRAGAGLLRDAAVQAGPDILTQFEADESKLLERIAKKHGKTAAAARSDKPTADRLRRKWPVHYLMLSNWPRLGHLGEPGLMFFSDRALADFFSLLDWSGFDIRADVFDSEQVEQMRGRLGLRKANEKIPLVTGARINPEKGVIELNTSPVELANREWPKLPLRLRCPIELNGRILYAGDPRLKRHGVGPLVSL